MKFKLNKFDIIFLCGLLDVLQKKGNLDKIESDYCINLTTKLLVIKKEV